MAYIFVSLCQISTKTTVMRRIYWLFLLQLLPFLGLRAQVQSQAEQIRRVYMFPYERRLRLNVEIGASAGLLQPLGWSRGSGRDVLAAGYAQIGYGGELWAQHRLRRHALWSVGFLVGYAHNPFASDTLQLSQTDLANRYAVQGQTRNGVYLMPSLAFRGGKSFKFELTLGIGTHIGSGGATARLTWQEIQPNQWQHLQETWRSKNAVATGFRASFSLGYLFKSRFFLGAQASYLHFSGSNIRSLTEKTYIWNSDTNSPQNLLTDGNFRIKQPFKIQNAAFSLVAKYQLYKTLYPHTRTKDGIIYH
jgi:hypothetical protein